MKWHRTLSNLTCTSAYNAHVYRDKKAEVFTSAFFVCFLRKPNIDINAANRVLLFYYIFIQIKYVNQADSIYRADNIKKAQNEFTISIALPFFEA